jgi:hypothetical protein
MTDTIKFVEAHPVLMLTVLGLLWSLVLYLAKMEIARIREDFKELKLTIKELSNSLNLVTKELYKLKGEHEERCRVNAA